MESLESIEQSDSQKVEAKIACDGVKRCIIPYSGTEASESLPNIVSESTHWIVNIPA